jgi:hypothetical protein
MRHEKLPSLFLLIRSSCLRHLHGRVRGVDSPLQVRHAKRPKATGMPHIKLLKSNGYVMKRHKVVRVFAALIWHMT